jgi:serine/threonine protein phosphatase 1
LQKGSSFKMERRTQQDTVITCDHTSQASGLPLDPGYAVCIDTHACGGGWLSCLETESGMYWQANQNGELPSGRLK